MVPELLHCIEQLQSELAMLHPQGESARVTSAVARIAAELRGSRLAGQGDSVAGATQTLDFPRTH